MMRHRVMCLLSLLLVTLLVVPARAESKCLCQVSSCLCCVELNLTSSIDLGGPACVNIRQQERNVSLNLNYADNPVHNATIALDAAARKPTCMNLLSDLAQICAKFVSMKKSEQEGHGYVGCLVIEPALLGSPQATYPVGCFTFNGGQVRQAETSSALLDAEQTQKQDVNQEQEQEEEEEDDPGLNAEELIAAVSASAEQGIALFSQWLGLNLPGRFNTTNASNEEVKSRKLNRPLTKTFSTNRYGRTTALFAQNEEKSDEEFKQLLSAQDNILKEPMMIGKSTSDLATTFVYPRTAAEEVGIPNGKGSVSFSPENIAFVPSESRRGGRAYNIHQHVNEV